MLHVVHHRDYMAPPPERGTFKFDKYQLVMICLRESGAAMTEHAPPPMPRDWLAAVHDPDYVDSVLAADVPREKERRIGFPVTPHIAQRVQHTNGGTWRAAHLAMEHGFAANSAGGSHHSLHDTGAGYCVFNELAVSANRLIAQGVPEEAVKLAEKRMVDINRAWEEIQAARGENDGAWMQWRGMFVQPAQHLHFTIECGEHAVFVEWNTVRMQQFENLNRCGSWVNRRPRIRVPSRVT